MQVGATIANKYVVTAVLGEGGMGVVYRATHNQLSHEVAIKVLRAEYNDQPEVVARFQREAQAAAALRSRHVARTLDVGTLADGRPFMVLEFLEGNDLGDELERRGRLPVPEAVWWVLQACEGIAEAHARKIVHRDLKPENLFLAAEGRTRTLKILDFGISRMLDDKAARLTQSQSCFGTPLYMSPEQMLSPKDTDERTDVWALGVILYELITGSPPFEGETFAGISIAIAGHPIPPLSKHLNEVPPGLEAVVARALAKDVEARYSSVIELADALTPFAKERVRAATTSPLGTPTSDRARELAAYATENRLQAAGRTLPTDPSLSATTPSLATGPASLAQTMAAASVAQTPRRIHPAVWVGALVLVGGAAAVGAIALGSRSTDTPSPSAANATPTASNVTPPTPTDVESAAPVVPTVEPASAPPPSGTAPMEAVPSKSPTPKANVPRPPPPVAPQPPAPHIPKFNE